MARISFDTYESIRVDVTDGVATLTLHRPDRLNSFTVAMHGEVRAALDAIAADRSIRCFVLTGAGRGFCAGQDLSDRAVGAGCRRSRSRRLDRELLQAAAAASARAADADRSRRSTVWPPAPAQTFRLRATWCTQRNRQVSFNRFQSWVWCPIAAAPGGCRDSSGPARAMGMTLLGEKLTADTGGGVGFDLALCGGRSVDADGEGRGAAARGRSDARLRTHSTGDRRGDVVAARRRARSLNATISASWADPPTIVKAYPPSSKNARQSFTGR